MIMLTRVGRQSARLDIFGVFGVLEVDPTISSQVVAVSWSLLFPRVW